MERRSTRLRSKLSLNNASLSSLTTTSTGPPNKKRKIESSEELKEGNMRSTALDSADAFYLHRNNSRGQRGVLKQLATEAPLDIMLEILRHMDFPDLLALSRSSKQFRAMLLSKSTPGMQALWKHVRESANDLPDKPDGISEPFFASLLFDSYCMRCNTPKAKACLYLRRLCQTCFLQITTNELTEYVKASSSGKTLRQLGTSWDVLRPYLPIYRYFNGWRYIPTLSIRDAFTLLDDFENTDPALRAELLEKQTTVKKAKETFTEMYSKWLLQKDRTRFTEINNLRKARFDAIIERLTDLGWAEDLTDRTRGRLRNLPLAKKPQALTNRIWTNISTELLEFMQNARKDRIAREIRDTIVARSRILHSSRDAFLLTQPSGTLIPRGPDLALMPPFRKIMMKDLESLDLPEDSFNNVWNEALPLIAKWQHTALQRALATSPSFNTEEDLSPAIVKWDCSVCNRILSYPPVLVHKCTSPAVFNGDDMFSFYLNLSQEKQILIALGESRLSDRTLTLRGSEREQTLLSKCGLPHTATLEDIRRLNPVFIRSESYKFGPQNPASSTAVVYNYPSASSYEYIPVQDLEYLPREKHKHWNVNYDESAAPLEPQGRSVSRYGFKRRRRIWEYDLGFRCRKCPALISTRTDPHFPSEHSIEHPVLGRDYVFNLDFMPVWTGWTQTVSPTNLDEINTNSN
ncbi:hypothetical protein DL96DRAFT_842722 [Flagelloscypha sp. PMI_526]|nr:hypothetical protein DL96DRAFT_842722 [Flagelloscypha sp. PMI_526]